MEAFKIIPQLVKPAAIDLFSTRQKSAQLISNLNYKYTTNYYQKEEEEEVEVEVGMIKKNQLKRTKI